MIFKNEKKTIRFVEGGYQVTLKISMKKFFGYKIIGGLSLELKNKNGKIWYDIETKTLIPYILQIYLLEKSIDIRTSKINLDTLIGSNELTLQVNPIKMSEDNSITKYRIRDGKGFVNIIAEKEDGRWHIYGTIKYPETRSGIIRHSLGVIIEETGINLSKYISLV